MKEDAKRNSAGVFISGNKVRLGMKHSEETRKKMSEVHKNDRPPSRKGVKMSPTSIEKIRAKMKGKRPKNNLTWIGSKHPNWKGGVTTQDKLERVKFQQQFQKLVFERDNYTCQICGVRGKENHVDHIKSWAKYPELRFNLDNCRTLCKECHYEVTFHRKISVKGLKWGGHIPLGTS